MVNVLFFVCVFLHNYISIEFYGEFSPKHESCYQQDRERGGGGGRSECLLLVCLYYSKCNVPVIISQEVSMVHMIHQDNHSPQEEVLLQV